MRGMDAEESMGVISWMTYAHAGTFDTSISFIHLIIFIKKISLDVLSRKVKG